MPDKELDSLVTTANHLADIAGGVIRQYFRKDVETDFKEAASPIVTIADKRAEKEMRDYVEKHFPDHGIIGEEYGIKPSNSRYTWIFDPIDGTIAFSTGKTQFGTLISLLIDDSFCLGIIDQPVVHERWLGVRGRKTIFNGQPVQAKKNLEPGKASMSTTSPYMFDKPQLHRAFDALRKSVHVVSFGGDCYQYGLLASGYIDIVIESGLQLHDFAALVPVIEGSGGLITDFEGQPLNSKSSGDVLVCSNKAIQIHVLGIMRAANS